MKPLVPCPACSRHRRGDGACPHCGAAAGASLAARLTRHARIGGLALFTAATATACYGTPPAPQAAPSASPGAGSPAPASSASPRPSASPGAQPSTPPGAQP